MYTSLYKVLTFEISELSIRILVKLMQNKFCLCFIQNAEALLCGVNPAVMRQHHAAWYRTYIKRRLLKNSRSNKDSMYDMPFCRKPSRSQFLQWVQCDTCNRWCHTECVNLSSVPRGSFYCVLCIS